MAEQRDTPLMIISVDENLDGLRSETEKFTSKIGWITVSPALFDQILKTVQHPETRTHRDRPQRKEEGDE